MAGVGHSNLLKFLVDTSKITMSDQNTDAVIESQVPIQQQLRRAHDTDKSLQNKNENNNLFIDNKDNIPANNEVDIKDISPHKSEDINKSSNRSLLIDREEKTTAANEDSDNISSKEEVTRAAKTDKTDKPADEDSTNSKEDDSATEESSAAASIECYSPVITVTKEETTLTKEGLKMQRVIVSEDISDATNQSSTLIAAEQDKPGDTHRVIRSEVLAVSMRADTQTEPGDEEPAEGENHKDLKKIQTKIPKLRLKQVVERIRREKEEKLKEEEIKKSTEQKHQSSIPRLKDTKSPPRNNQTDSIENKNTLDVVSPKVDDEFDKIYEEIIENEALNNVPSPEKISDPIKLESKFEEIIHAYDDNNDQPIVGEKTKSKIPLLKRKSEHDIVVPPPSNRKHSLKRSNSEDFKGKIPVVMSVSKEIPLKTNAETNNSNMISDTKKYETNNGIQSEVLVKTITTQTSIDFNKVDINASSSDVFIKPETTMTDHNLRDSMQHKHSVSKVESNKTENIITSKTSESISGMNSNILSIQNVESLNSDSKTTLKTVTTQTSIEMKKLDTIRSTENIVNLEKSNNSNEKITPKCKIPVANENIKPHNINTDIKLNTTNNVELHGRLNTSRIKTVTTQTSIQANKVEETLLKENDVTKLEKTNDDTVKGNTKCKIPVASNSKESRKINSVAIIKPPTRINVTDKISNPTKSDDTEDVVGKKVEKQPTNFGTHGIKSATLLLQSIRNSQVSGPVEIGKKVIIEINTSKIDNTNNVSTVTQVETKKLISEGPTITSTLIKSENNNITKKEVELARNLSSPNKAEHDSNDANKSISKDSHLKENKDLNATAPKQVSTLIKSPEKTVDTTKPSKVTDVRVHSLQNKNEMKNPTSPTSDNIGDSKKIVNNDTVVIRTKNLMKEIKVERKSAEMIVQDSKFTVQYFKNTNEPESNKPDDNILETGSKQIEKTPPASEGIRKDRTKLQTNNNPERNPESPIRTVLNDVKPQTDLSTQLKNTDKMCDLNQKQIIETLIQTSNTPDITAKEATFSYTKIKDSHIINEQIIPINKENNMQIDSEKGKSKAEDPSSIRTNIEDKEEEDIILLKGKVSRVIRRLDSKDLKVVKREVDDLPAEVSVISKIAMFERSEPTDTLSKTELNINNTEATNEQNLVNIKPKVVNEILKTDINHNVMHQPDTVPQTNDVENVKVNAVENKRVFKTKNKINEGRPLRRTQSSFAAGGHDVITATGDGPASSEIWKEYRRKKELDLEMRRSWSLAELELGSGDEVRGRVRRLVARLSGSGDEGPGVRQHEVKGKDRVPGSVAQRVALYESKLTPSRGERHLPTPPSTPPASSSSISSEELRIRLQELQTARAQYGTVLVPATELSDGAKMPVLALGTANLEPELVTAVVSAAIDLGYRAIDTAPIYGTEREVGRAIRDKIADGTVTRSELFIISKLWSTSHRRDLVEEACRRSLEALGLDYVDLYLIHNPMSFKEGPNPLPKIANVLQYSSHDYLEAWFGIEGLVKKGLVRRAGLSNFNSVQVERVLEKGRIKPVINQVECHPYLTQLRLDEFCAARHIKLSCFGVLGSKGAPAGYTSGLAPVIDDPLVKVMAAGLGVTPAQLLISYQLRLGRAVVVKSARASHLSQAAAATVAAPLDAATVAALSALNRNKRIFTFKGMGDTHKNYPFRIPF